MSITERGEREESGGDLTEVRGHTSHQTLYSTRSDVNLGSVDAALVDGVPRSQAEEISSEQNAAKSSCMKFI